MEQLLSQLCFLMATQSGIPENPCINSFRAIYVQSQAKNINDLAAKYYEKKAFDYLGKEIIYSSAALWIMGDSYKREEIHFNAPIRPVAESLSVDWTKQGYGYRISWQWSF